MPRGAQPRLQQISHRRLAVGAGDPQQFQGCRRVAVHPGGDRSQQCPRVRGHEHRDASARGRGRRDAFGAGPVGQHGHGTGRDRLLDKGGPVHMRTGQGRVQVTRAHRTRVVGNPADDHPLAGAAGHRKTVVSGGQLGERPCERGNRTQHR